MEGWWWDDKRGCELGSHDDSNLSESRDFLGGPVVRILPFPCTEYRVHTGFIPIEELRACMLHGAAKRKKQTNRKGKLVSWSKTKDRETVSGYSESWKPSIMQTSWLKIRQGNIQRNVWTKEIAWYCNWKKRIKRKKHRYVSPHEHEGR